MSLRSHLFKGLSRMGCFSTTKSKIPLVKRLVPEKYHAYVELGRYEKPIGFMLLYWPCAWGLSMATPLPPFTDYLVFLAGSISMRAAGCIVNDISDKDFDKNVQRTKDRPLASQRLTKTQAALFLIPNLAVGLAVLTQLTPASIAAAFGILPIVVLYPLMKRYTNYPQVVLGMAFNWGVIVSYLARSQVFAPEKVIPVYLAGICWTLIYDTIYAFQDIKDDERIGVKSTARTWKYNFNDVMERLIAGSGSLFVLAGIIGDYHPIYYPLVMGVHWIYWQQMRRVNLESSQQCGAAFQHSNYYGLAMAVILYLGNLFSSPTIELPAAPLKDSPSGASILVTEE